MTLRRDLKEEAGDLGTVTGGIIAGRDKEAMVLGLGDAVCGTVDCGVTSYPVTSLYFFILGCFLAFF